MTAGDPYFHVSVCIHVRLPQSVLGTKEKEKNDQKCFGSVFSTAIAMQERDYMHVSVNMYLCTSQYVRARVCVNMFAYVCVCFQL